MSPLNSCRYSVAQKGRLLVPKCCFFNIVAIDGGPVVAVLVSVVYHLMTLFGKNSSINSM